MAEANRYWKADLTLPPEGVISHRYYLTDHRLSWAQEQDRWLLLFYLHSGILTVGTRAYAYQPGTLAVIPPGTRAGHDKVGEDCKLYWLDFLLRGTEGPVISLPLIHQLPDAQWMVDELETARNMVGRTKAQITSILWATLWRISQPASLHRDDEELYEAERFILANMERPLRVDQVAGEVGVSSRTLLRMFRQAHGLTVEQYIASQRLEAARRLLATTELPIKAVAARIGIHSFQHFNRVIREATGLSPTAYRERSFRSL